MIGQRTGVAIRAKEPPAEISTAKEALDAFDRVCIYISAARNAHVKANWYTPGTHSFYKHLEREDLYEDAAMKWEVVLRNWLTKQVAR